METLILLIYSIFSIAKVIIMFGLVLFVISLFFIVLSEIFKTEKHPDLGPSIVEIAKRHEVLRDRKAPTLYNRNKNTKITKQTKSKKFNRLEASKRINFELLREQAKI